jgi:Tol biopolymer transport system component/tRNA A-37 threonylcarbamoyl transferase component Bud32
MPAGDRACAARGGRARRRVLCSHHPKPGRATLPKPHLPTLPLPLEQLTAALADRYRIEREIGRGGMATVFLAEDIRHQRHVALKLLHPELGAVLGTERFLAEIRTTANLQHPNILPLFDSGAAGGLVYYVMPFVEGETLRARLEREGPLPVGDAVRIATGVAAALDLAHRKGIIHRDIKPENILLQDGQALVADFGVALAVSNAAGSRITQTGISVGTPAYMSPEQAAAERQLDGRSDQYALGAVLYEMLSGEAPFTGPNATTIMSRLMTEAPRPLPQRRASVPPQVADAVHRALEKVPGDRFATAAEFARALEAPATPARGSHARPRPSRLRWAIAAAGTVAGVALGFFLGTRAGASDGARTGMPSRLALLIPWLGGSGTGAASRVVGFMPDGSALLFGARSRDDPNVRLHLQPLESELSTTLPGTDFAFAPSVSPDGRWIAGRSVGNELLLLPMGGAAADARPIGPGYAFYAWHPDGTLWVTRSPYRRIERLRPGERTPQPMLERLESPMWMQQVLADGQLALVVLAGMGFSSGNGAVLDLRTGAYDVIVPENVVMMRMTAGHLVWLRSDGTLVAARFDEGRGVRVGEPTVIATSVSVSGTGDGQFEVARNGSVAYIPEAPRSLVVVDRSGRASLLSAETGAWHFPRFAPDGRRLIADRVTAEGRNVWLFDLAQQTVSRLTFAQSGHDAVWSRDGRTIHFLSDESGVLGVRRVRLGSDAPAESLFTARNLSYAGDWLPDGSALVGVANDLRADAVEDIVLIRDSGRGPLEPLVATEHRESHPALSYDGEWLAFASDRSGRSEVYVRAMRGDRMLQISNGGGSEPVWSRDGRELFYRSSADSGLFLMRVEFAASPEPRVAARGRMFAIEDYLGSTPHANYDVAPDGRGFVFVKRNELSRIVVIQNLPALVERLGGRREAP